MINFVNGVGIKATLIDFGFATKYQDSQTKEHFEQQTLDSFKGNLTYSSLNLMDFLSASRRDDFISIFYMLATILNNNKFPCSEDLNRNLDFSSDSAKERF